MPPTRANPSPIRVLPPVAKSWAAMRIPPINAQDNTADGCLGHALPGDQGGEQRHPQRIGVDQYHAVADGGIVQRRYPGGKVQGQNAARKDGQADIPSGQQLELVSPPATRPGESESGPKAPPGRRRWSARGPRPSGRKWPRWTRPRCPRPGPDEDLAQGILRSRCSWTPAVQTSVQTGRYTIKIGLDDKVLSYHLFVHRNNAIGNRMPGTRHKGGSG